MQIVIEVSDELYARMKIVNNNGMGSDAVRIILNGTVLPKGHGRLGDLDELEQRISNFVEHDVKITDEYTVVRQRFIVDGIRQTPTIIESDKEREDKE